MEHNQEKAYVSKSLRKNLFQTKTSTGYIAGWETNGGKFLVAASGCTDFIPYGLKELGIFYEINEISCGEDEEVDSKLLDVCTQVQMEDPIVLLISKNEDDIHITAKQFSSHFRTFKELELLDLNNNPTLLLRACGKMPLIFEVSSDSDTLQENIELSIEKIRTVISKEISAFLLRNSNLLLTSTYNSLTSDLSITCKDLSKFIDDTDSQQKAQKGKAIKKKCPINFDILLQTSGDSAIESTVNHCLVIHCQRREFQCVSLSLPIDVFVVCLESDTTKTIYQQFISAVEHQLEKMNECMLKYAKNLEYITPVPYHFYPDIWDYPVTVVYPLNKNDEELESYREDLHKLLLLPLDRPFIKKLNAYNFSPVTSSGCLINPHEGLSSSGVIEGMIAIVEGRYSYHHYMQDRMDDNGWGCAYRSLQTIISWFKFQGYTDQSIPTHKEIQQALVDIGDKPKSFVGSRQWIGSQEVSFCLDHLIQVQSKIVTVNSGSEMASLGRTLYNHFRDQGTPVMIGGGVLAHTILGVDFNKHTGELKFLILDPHYTGSEDLSLIQNKGWCGWKGIQFWDPNSFYNLCLPQRPQQI